MKHRATAGGRRMGRSKFASPVRSDEHGIYVVTNGAKYRPGGIPGYDHAYDMGDAGLKKGDRVWARHKAQTPLALVSIEAPARTLVWGNDYMHERYVRGKGLKGIETGKGLVTPGGCLLPGVSAAVEGAPAHRVPIEPLVVLKPDADAELDVDEGLALAIAACAPPFTPEISKSLITASALAPELFLNVVAKHRGTPLDGLPELTLRMLQARLRLVREKMEGEMTAAQAKAWGFTDTLALTRYTREDHKR